MPYVTPSERHTHAVILITIWVDDDDDDDDGCGNNVIRPIALFQSTSRSLKPTERAASRHTRTLLYPCVSYPTSL